MGMTDQTLQQLYRSAPLESGHSVHSSSPAPPAPTLLEEGWLGSKDSDRLPDLGSTSNLVLAEPPSASCVDFFGP